MLLNLLWTARVAANGCTRVVRGIVGLGRSELALRSRELRDASVVHLDLVCGLNGGRDDGGSGEVGFAHRGRPDAGVAPHVRHNGEYEEGDGVCHNCEKKKTKVKN